ncbi:catalase [Bradyrhizobium lablabi]|uniref:catalase n=1 Tax=Bradyrhizobium lablabi TaxID=722472 RepID=UPI001BAA10E7|nr:catalase [Bradyrhizobium lablabi]MBR0696035.1 catalase [Bradyrhizobium lablabi]
MDDSSVAERLVDAVESLSTDHKRGTRPIHTIGVGVDGYFQPSEAARSYCKAEHFQRPCVRASVRFSNGSGSPVQHDGWSDVRGMATRFHLSDGSATDLIAMTLPEFFVPTVDQFFEFARTAKPKPVRRESPWQKILDMLQLKIPRRNPPPGQKESPDAGAKSFADRHRFAQLAVVQTDTIGAPVSYARAAYHAVHTFIVTAPDGVRRPVRFSWQPVAGVCNTKATATAVDNYLRQELEERLGRWPARFMLMMTIGEAGDALDDPTQPWPAKRVRVVMGTLTLKNVAADQVAAAERISFNPCRLVPGIEVSEDPILRARRNVYEVSCQRRNGIPCPFNGS